MRIGRSHFSAGRSSAKYLGLEHRPEQADMAQSVASALEADTPLLFEAGTGVGKSLAYLIPGLSTQSTPNDLHRLQSYHCATGASP